MEADIEKIKLLADVAPQIDVQSNQGRNSGSANTFARAKLAVYSRLLIGSCLLARDGLIAGTGFPAGVPRGASIYTLVGIGIRFAFIP